MRIVSVVGTRSDLVKCAPIARALDGRAEHVVVHTGHAFDYGTSPAFFADLDVAPPAHDLGLGDDPHAVLLRAMLAGLTAQLTPPPDWILVYGGSAATVAGALVGAKLGVRVAHVGAGLRSYRRRTPDEVNHIVADHLCALHFCPTATAVEALAGEGLRGVHDVGDVLLDHVVRGAALARERFDDASLSEVVGLDPSSPFAFATIHHHENTDNEARLAALIDAFSRLPWPVVLPLHTRTQESLTERPDVLSKLGANIAIVDPLLPTETLAVVSRAQVVLTDSGGLQREAYYVGVPCVTLRDDSEWVDTLDVNVVVGADAAAIVEAAERAARPPNPGLGPRIDGRFGDGRSAEKIADVLLA